jgi:hypothetical protein
LLRKYLKPKPGRQTLAKWWTPSGIEAKFTVAFDEANVLAKVDQGKFKSQEGQNERSLLAPVVAAARLKGLNLKTIVTGTSLAITVCLVNVVGFASL